MENNEIMNNDVIEATEEVIENTGMSKGIKIAACTCYIPSAIVGTAFVPCLIGASSTNFRRNAALAAAYTLSESTLKEYQEKVVETIGEKKERDIREQVYDYR